MSSTSRSASILFEDEYENLLAMVLRRISIECETHENIRIKPSCPFLAEYVREFGKLLRTVYKYNLKEALKDEISWYINLFFAKKLGLNGINLIIDSWIITIQGWLKSPECNELSMPLLELKKEIPSIIEKIKGKEFKSNENVSKLIGFLISGDFNKIQDLIKELFRGSSSEIITELIVPSTEMIGLLWERNELEIFEEHLATINIERLLNYLNFLYTPDRVYKKSVLISCVPGDAHDLAAKSLGSFLELKGWDVKNLGRGLPSEQILKAVRKLKPHFLVLVFTMISMLDEALDVVKLIKIEFPMLKIITGGRGALHSESILAEKGVYVAGSFNQCHDILTRLIG